MSTLPIPDEVRNARWVDLTEGETLEGRVVQLPTKGAFAGTRLFLQTDRGETVSIAAAARRGWSVLERSLTDEDVRVGDRIAVEFRGWRRTIDKERSYRSVDVQVLDRVGRVAA